MQIKNATEKSPYHLTLLAKNNTGYKNLIKLVSKGHLEGFYYKPRVDKKLLEEFGEGIIALSGCPNSQLSQAIVANDFAQAKVVVFPHGTFVYGWLSEKLRKEVSKTLFFDKVEPNSLKQKN